MSELDVFFKNMSESLKILAEGISAMAEKLDKISEPAETKCTKAPEEAPVKEDSADIEEISKDTEEPVEKKTKKARRKTRDSSDTETILQIIVKSKKEIDMDTLKEKTGFDGKKVANIVYRLKKQGLVESPSKGMYVKA